MTSGLLGRALRRLRPREGWLTLVVMLLVSLSLPLSLRESRWSPGVSGMLRLAPLAVFVGLRMAALASSMWAVLLGLVTGLVLVAAAVGNALPPWASVWRDAMSIRPWLRGAIEGHWSWNVPFADLLADIWSRLTAFAGRLLTWSETASSGGVSRDRVVLVFWVSLLVWVLAWIAGWLVGKKGKALWGLLPIGVALVSNLAFTGLGDWYLRGYLGGTLFLVAWAGFQEKTKSWEEQGLDFSDELHRYLGFFAAGIVVVALALPVVVPFVTSSKAVLFFWSKIEGPRNQVAQTLDRLFAGRNPVPTPPGGGDRWGHVLVGSVSPSSDLVMLVEVSDPAPLLPEELEMALLPYGVPVDVPQRYWRSVTYDRYTGLGWENSSEEKIPWQANEALARADLYPSEKVTQTYRLASAPGNDQLGFAVNQPHLVGERHDAVVREDGELVGFRLNDQVYSVTSHAPAATLQQLREAGDDYGEETLERYAQLPTVPQEVIDIAREITADARNAYDKASAIEGYLRGLEYSLKVPPPPRNRDVVDYFLCDVREGYCDYFATAMVVLCRIVGLPARYVSGYAMGEYDYNVAAYSVTGNNAHAWVEVHFPGLGWIEFEPTPTRARFTRRIQLPSGDIGIAVPTPTPVVVSVIQRKPLKWWYFLIAVILVAVVADLAASMYRDTRPRPTPQEEIRDIYAELCKRAERLGLGPDPVSTPREYIRSLATGLQDWGETSAGTRQEVEDIGAAYVFTSYGKDSLPPALWYQARTAWHRLEPKLRRTSIFSRAGRFPHPGNREGL